MVVALVVDTLVLMGPVSVASTMIQEDVIHLQGMHRVPDHIRITTSNHSDRVTPSPEGGIALYEGFLHTELCLPLHPFILSLLDHYQLVPVQLAPNAFRIICSFIILYHFHGIMARFSLVLDNLCPEMIPH